ncbi:MAG: YceI family protein [Alphaproteobacteria bacterium]|nr:YceI family protein [Alphaproteobacteria bacterium]
MARQKTILALFCLSCIIGFSPFCYAARPADNDATVSKEPLPSPVHFVIEKKSSTVEFEAKQQDVPTRGVFPVEGTIDFDPNQPEKSSIHVTVPIAALKISLKDARDLLFSPDWLDPERYPVATFQSQTIEKLNDTHFIVNGHLTIRNNALPVRFQFTLDTFNRNVADAHTLLNISRLEYNVGKGQWRDTKSIAEKVQLTIVIHAIGPGEPRRLKNWFGLKKPTTHK